MTEKKVSVASLGNPTKSGFLTKQGGSIKTWKKRWFVLKGDTLWYFKTQKDQEQTGSIKIEADTSVQYLESKSKKGSYVFSVGAKVREYVITADSEQVAKDWVKNIQTVVQEKKGGGSSSSSSSGSSAAAPAPNASPSPVKTADTFTSTPSNVSSSPPSSMSPQSNGSLDKSIPAESGTNPRTLLELAKGSVDFINREAKIGEFWQLWMESIPPASELNSPDMVIEYNIVATANMQKLTWRTAGPQFVFIQKMVDFFWNVGAPESEIDRLNDVGVLINPQKIGSWIDMSSKLGMDGGWYFPVNINVEIALEAADPGKPVTAVREWAARHSVLTTIYIGRDMGAAPPRQTEIRVLLPGKTYDEQMNVARDAYRSFTFPEPPQGAFDILNQDKKEGLQLSIITSSEGFVRLGLLSPKPRLDNVVKLCQVVKANNEALGTFEGSLGTDGPEFVELQYLNPGFGYNVYNEGFDVVFHYCVGYEKALVV